MVRVSALGAWVSLVLVSSVVPRAAAQAPSASFPEEAPQAAAPPPPEGAPAPTPTAPAGSEASPASSPPPPGTAPSPAPNPPPAPPPPPAAPPPNFAYAGEQPLEAPPANESKHDVSLTISPLHLFMPLFELTAEVRVANGLGLALIGGVGSYTATDSSLAGDTLTVYEFGGQVLGYPIRDFKSLQLGAEILWVRVEGDDLGSSGVTGVGAGLGVGPLVGYKVLTDGGFTFVVQGGFQYLAITATASDGEGTTESAEARQVIPLLNLNLGWSI